MKALKCILLTLSFVSFVLFFIFDKIYLSICSIPFIGFIFVLFHEFGHVVGCLIVGTKVNFVESFGFVFGKNLEIKNNLAIYGKTNFNATEKSRCVYLFGIIFSTIFTAATILLFVFGIVDYVILITICFAMLVTLIPFKESDIVKIFERKK